MAKFEIYKRGQGIYVRFGTVIAMALILLLGLNWLFTQIGTMQPAMPVAASQPAMATTQVSTAVHATVGAAGAEAPFSWHASWLYVQAGIVLIVGVCGGLAIFFGVNHPKFAEFQIATESEMRKVTWPSRRTVIRSTQVIILMTLLMSLILFGVDVGFVWFFKLIGIIAPGSES